jgi:hypothetical protein
VLKILQELLNPHNMNIIIGDDFYKSGKKKEKYLPNMEGD